MVEAIFGSDGFLERKCAERFDRIHVDLATGLVQVRFGIVKQTSDMRIAVRLWIRGLSNPSNW